MFSLHCEINRNNTYQWDAVFGQINTDEYDIWGTAGAGNQAIAARVLHQLGQETYKKVVVVWSGVNRLDAAAESEWHNINQKQTAYEYITSLDNTVYYHSGGLLGVYNDMPSAVLEYFKSQIKTFNRRYLTDNTLRAVIATQSLLQARGIEYSMGWMYNPFADYSDSQIEPGCGQIDIDSGLYKLVNWGKINQNWAYEWCLSRNMMYPDGFHWSWTGGREWFRQVIGEDIYKS
jgi:hypothetical protein